MNRPIVLIFIFFLANFKVNSQEAFTIIPAQPSDSFESSLTAIFKASVLSDEVLLNDQNIQSELKRFREIGYKVYSQTEDSRPITFHVYDDDSLNAFALPGGFIFITTGMINLKLKDEEIAHLLGHEIAHVVRDHHLQHSSQNIKATLSSLLLSVALTMATYQKMKDENNNIYTEDSYRQYQQESLAALRATAIIPALTHYLLTAKYTREMERDADIKGREYANKAGYPNKGAEKLFDMMSKVDNHKINIYFRSHPYMIQRADSARLSVEGVSKEDLEKSTLEKKMIIQKKLLSYILYYEREQESLLKRFTVEKRVERILAYYQVIMFLAEMSLEINANHQLSQYSLKSLYKQEALKTSLHQPSANWGRLLEYYQKISPKETEVETIEKKAAEQQLKLYNSISNNRAGIPICREYLLNFSKSIQITSVKIAYLKSLLIVKDYNSFENYFIKAVQQTEIDQFKEEFIKIIKHYMIDCKMPYQLIKIVGSLNHEETTQEANKKVIEILKKTHNLKEIYLIIKINPVNKIMDEKELTEKHKTSTQWNFAQAKFLEKEGIKGKALQIYNEIILYGFEGDAKSKAEDALKTLGYQ